MTFDIKAIESEAYHRNGMGGEGFHVAIVRAKVAHERAHRRFLCIRLGKQARTAIGAIPCFVLDLAEIAKGNIAFGDGNSWRGDEFAYAMGGDPKE